MAEWRAGDAQILVTAGSLKAASKLRKLFEARLGSDNEKLSPRLHFVRDTVEALGGVPATSWVATMLHQFPTFLDSGRSGNVE